MSDPHNSVFVLLAWAGAIGVTVAVCYGLHLNHKDRQRRISRREARQRERAAARGKGKRRV